MGGRGSLGHKRFSYPDLHTITKQLQRRRIEFRYAGRNDDDKIKRYANRHNLALLSTIAKQVTDLSDKYGYKFSAIKLETPGEAEGTKPTVASILATGKKTGTLVVRLHTHGRSLREINNVLKKANNKNYVVTRNIKEAVLHEYGHLLMNKMTEKNPKAVANLNKKLAEIYAKGKHANVSDYSSKKVRESNNYNEAIAESMAIILGGRRSKGGKKVVKAVRTAFQDAGMLKKPKKVKAKPVKAPKVTTPKPPKPKATPKPKKTPLPKQVTTPTPIVDKSRGTTVTTPTQPKAPNPNKMSKADFLKAYMEAQRNKKK